MTSYVLPVKNLTDEEINSEFDEDKYEKGFQCEFCKGYRKINSDYGICWNKDSIIKNRIVFEHFACKKFEFKKDLEYDGEYLYVDYKVFRKIIDKEKELKDGKKMKFNKIVEQAILEGLQKL